MIILFVDSQSVLLMSFSYRDIPQRASGGAGRGPSGGPPQRHQEEHHQEGNGGLSPFGHLASSDHSGPGDQACNLNLYLGFSCLCMRLVTSLNYILAPF